MYTVIFIVLLLHLFSPIFLLRPFDPRIIFSVSEAYIIEELIQNRRGRIPKFLQRTFQQIFTYICTSSASHLGVVTSLWTNRL
jgi:hypothetical protein